MNPETKTFVAKIVNHFAGDTDKAARCIAYEMRVCGIREARQLVAEAVS